MACRKLWMALTIVLLGASLAYADLDLYLSDLNVSARADFGDFRAQVGAHFGVSDRDLDLVFQAVAEPGDAVICLWLGQRSHQPYDVVVREYRARKGEGWGALAQSLGIKPGSPEFKALKRGELGWAPAKRGSDKPRHDGHDHDDDHGKGEKHNGKGKKSH